MENLIALLLQARNTAHVHHWKTRSFAQHLALEELYELLLKFTDELAEMAMGHGIDLNPDWNSPSGWDTNDVLVFVGQLHTHLEGLKSTLPQEDWLINKYEELQAEVARVKYKLERLR